MNPEAAAAMTEVLQEMGATIERRGSLVRATLTPEARRAYLETPMAKAFNALDKAQLPCWRCTRRGFAAIWDGGGVFDCGIIRRFKTDGDACEVCGHVTTAGQMRKMVRRLAQMRRSQRKSFRDPYTSKAFRKAAAEMW